MAFEDRIVTTSLLHGSNAEPDESVSLPAQLVARLADDGLHVLVPRGPAPTAGEVLVCEAQLDTGDESPTCVPVLVPRSLWVSLPTAFTVVRAASHLLPSAVAVALAEIAETEGDPDPLWWDGFNEEED